MDVCAEPPEHSVLLSSGDRNQSRTKRYDSSDHQQQRKLSNASTTTVEERIPDEKKPSGFRFIVSLSRRKKCTLLLFTMAMFLSGVALSLLGPFFWTEAAKKGMGLTLVGFVFAIFEIIIFFTAPLFGNYLLKLGPKFVLISGVFLAGACNILFGTLMYIPSGTPFIVFSILVRAVEALGFSGFTTASYAIMSSEFKENVGFTLGILETGGGVGFMLGPSIGGALYELGGFGLPFYFAGVAVLINAAAVYKFLPTVETLPPKRRGSVVTLLRSPLIIVCMGSVIVGMIGITTYDATFAQRLEPLNLSVGIVGLVFGVVALLYSIMSSIWGYLSDTKNIQTPLIIGGHLVYGIGFSLVGPSFLLPFLPDTSLPVIIVGLVCVGSTFGCLLIPNIKCMIIGATELGFENNLDTYALVSGLYKSVQTFGGFVGPVGIAYLIQKFDFPTGYGVVGLCSFFMMVVSLIFFVVRNMRRKAAGVPDNDGESLTSSISTHYIRKRSISVSEI